LFIIVEIIELYYNRINQTNRSLIEDQNFDENELIDMSQTS